MAYKPIGEYGVIGDMHTIALVAIDGSIDWFCAPRFDSPSIFGAILDDKKGGYFRISPSSRRFTSRQFYFPESNVLVTRFSDGECVVQLADFMPIPESSSGSARTNSRTVIRHVTAIERGVTMKLECLPAFDYARSGHETRRVQTGIEFHPTSGPAVGLSITDHYVVVDKCVIAEFELKEGESKTFVLSTSERSDQPPTVLTPVMGEEVLKQTVDYWRRWLSHCNYQGRWRESVYRSVLTLKLLTYQPTGAVVAAGTTSLPEEIGGERNWDYRYSWIRDSAFSLYALMRVGLTDEARAFMEFIIKRVEQGGLNGPLDILYSIGGETPREMESLGHLDGYRGSRPVRIGNDASAQLQLDIYGELLDAVYLYNKYGTPISYDLWQAVREMLNWVVENWQQPDEGIWEVRGGRRQFVHSKLMCWVALDRGLRLANHRSLPADLDLWRRTRDEIHESILTQGWNAEIGSFVQYFGSDTLDASTLLMPLMFFISPSDPRMISTIKAVEKNLTRDGLVYRYDPQKSPDGLAGHEGTFTICTFWLVEALTRSGYLDDARWLFERMLGYANHLGLYSEEIGPTGDLLGNFPQAFTHLALISAAFNLDRALQKGS